MTKSAGFTATASGDTVILAAPGAGLSYSFRYVYVTDSDVGVKFKGGDNDLTGVMPAGANGGVASPIWLRAGENESVSINLSGAATSGGGHVEYTLNQEV